MTTDAAGRLSLLPLEGAGFPPPLVIVNATPNGWEIIYHRAHALLADQLAGQWQRKNAPAYFYSSSFKSF